MGNWLWWVLAANLLVGGILGFTLTAPVFAAILLCGLLSWAFVAFATSVSLAIWATSSIGSLVAVQLGYAIALFVRAKLQGR